MLVAVATTAGVAEALAAAAAYCAVLMVFLQLRSEAETNQANLDVFDTKW